MNTKSTTAYKALKVEMHRGKKKGFINSKLKFYIIERNMRTAYTRKSW